MCVIHVPSVLKWAEMHKTALGRGRRFPQLVQLTRERGISNSVHRVAVSDEKDWHLLRRNLGP